MKWLPKKCVVVPTDFSEHSVQAIHTSLEMVEHGSAVHVLHVLPGQDYTSELGLYAPMNDETRVDAAENHLKEFLKRHDLDGVKSQVRVGDPGFGISEYAKEVAADLIVMPSHGYHGVRRILLGSVAERVLRHAECPVLVLRRSGSD